MSSFHRLDPKLGSVSPTCRTCEFERTKRHPVRTVGVLLGVHLKVLQNTLLPYLQSKGHVSPPSSVTTDFPSHPPPSPRPPPISSEVSPPPPLRPGTSTFLSPTSVSSPSLPTFRLLVEPVLPLVATPSDLENPRTSFQSHHQRLPQTSSLPLLYFHLSTQPYSFRSDSSHLIGPPSPLIPSKPFPHYFNSSDVNSFSRDRRDVSNLTYPFRPSSLG